MIVFIVSITMDTFGMPQTLYRLYVLLVSLIVLLFLYHWFRQSSIRNETGFSIWSIRLFAGLFAFIAVAEIFGNHGIAKDLFLGTIRSMAILLPYLLLIHIIQGVFHWVFFSSPVWQVKLLRSRADYCVQRSVFLFTAALIGFGLLPGLLVVWDLYDNVLHAVKSIYSYGLNIGTLHLSVGMAAASVTVFYLAFLISRILPRVVLDELFTGRKLTRGVQLSIAQLIQYCLLFIGFILVLVTLGFDFTKFTIIVSALGVGIGFGLQGIVNNFVCGLILLFERPLTEGDTIELGTRRAHIKKLASGRPSSRPWTWQT